MYGPNRDTQVFYQNLSDNMVTYEQTLFNIAGDLNLTLNPDLDSHNYINLNNPRSREKVRNILQYFNILDCWRENNIEKREYTRFRRNPVKKEENIRYDLLELNKTINGWRVY